jgi:hypothetical protein
MHLFDDCPANCGTEEPRRGFIPADSDDGT